MPKKPMMMKAAQLGWTGPGAGKEQGKSRAGVGQEQGKSRAEAGAGVEQGKK